VKYKQHNYFVRKNRYYNGLDAVNGIMFFIKNIIFSGIIFLIFIFATNLIIKYLVSKSNIKIPEISLVNFNAPKFIIIENKNFYALYGNGSVKFIESNIDDLILPVISGISINEVKEANNEVKNRLIREILKIKKKFLVDISEINIRNPENIIILTNEGKKIFMGSSISNEKFENYSLVKDRLKNMKIKYKSVSLLDDDRVIIKKEGK